MNSFRRGEASIRGDLGRASVLGLIVTLSLPPALAAQSVTLRLGGFRMSYDDSLKATAAAVAAEGLWSWRTARAGLAGSLATFDGGGWAGQGTASAARALLGGGRRALYAAGDATGYGFEGGYWAGTASAGLAGATALGPFGATLYLAGGGVRRIDGGDDPLVQATLRVQRNARWWAADAWTSATRTGGVRFTDIGAGLETEGSRFELGLAGGARFGDLGDRGWGRARLAWRVAGPGWVEASAGRYPPDVTGFPHGSFVQAGIRIALGRTGPLPVLAPSEMMTVRRVSAGAVVVTFRVADRVPTRIAGDWNDWAPQSLQRLSGGRWRVRLVLAPGLHRFTLLDAAGNAFVPAGIPTEPDDFGGSTGLLAVPQR